jgi:antitoxin ParD1/3/4
MRPSKLARLRDSANDRGSHPGIAGAVISQNADSRGINAVYGFSMTDLQQHWHVWDRVIFRRTCANPEYQLHPKMDKAVTERIANGQYANASEVLRAGLRALEQDEMEQAAKMEALRSALIEGEESGTAEEGVFDRVLAGLSVVTRRTLP